MKHGGLVFAGIALALLLAFAPLTAQSSSINYQTYMIDTFDDPEGQDWAYHAVGSKFVTEGYPVLKYIDGMPHSVRVMQEDPEKAKFLGMQVKFNRKGDNWVDIIPTKKGDKGLEAYEIPFKGRIHRLDMWVWGAGFYYYIEITVPTNIPQASKYLGNKNKLTFVAFRIRTSPGERVDDFKIYFDQFKALTDAFVDSFDGYELGDIDFEKQTE